MRPRRKSKIFEAALVVGATACAAPLETSLEVKDTTRHPDGVLVEPPPAMPPAEEHGSAAAGVVALRTPISDEQIGDVVRKYVHAFTDGNIEAFDDLLDENAVQLGDGGHSQPRPQLLMNLRNRFTQHAQDYRAIHEDIARLDRIERWSSDDLGPFTDPPRPPEMRKGDLLVRVPLDPRPSSTGDPLFHNTLVLLLRRGPDRALRIAGLAETDTP